MCMLKVTPCGCCRHVAASDWVSGGTWLPIADVRPGQPAPESGCYQLLNVFSTPSGEETIVEQGCPTPGAPHGYMWRLKGGALSSLSADHLLERAAEIRAMAGTARSLEAADALIRLADRFEKLAVERRDTVAD